DDSEHVREPDGEVGGRRQPIRDAGVADLGLGPDEALSHRRFGSEQSASDLGGRQSTDESQCQRHSSPRSECRMTAGEDQPQAVVLYRRVDLFRFARMEKGCLYVFREANGLSAQPVDCPVAGGGDDPSRSSRRRPLFRPSFERLRERVLNGFLGHVDVTEGANEDGHGPGVLMAEHSSDGRVVDHSWIGRTSIARGVRMPANLSAHWSASSRSAAWITVNPPKCSLASMYGPSVTRALSP